MAFVGESRGDYITETTYKYVGQGAGIYTMVAPRRSFLGVAVGVSALLGLVLLALLWPRGATTTSAAPTISTTPAPVGTCSLWGDPHITTFDGAKPSFYGGGEFWIVRSDEVHIQGRYLGTTWTNGLAATNKIVVGGPFLQGHQIMVGTVDSGEISVDGRPVLGSLGSTYDLAGLGSLSYSGIGELVDQAQTEFPKRIVRMALPQGVTITVMRWPNYLDLKIEMPRQPNQDGSCGNFNMDAADDSSEAIIQRIGDRVAPGDCLFHSRAPVTLSTEMQGMLARECVGQPLVNAQRVCQGSTQSDACRFDVCFGMNGHARKEALTYAPATR